MKMRSAFALALFAGAGCSQGDQRLSEKAAIEGEAAAQAETDVQAETLRQRATEMEEDLDRRVRLNGALSGVFEGDLGGDSTLALRVRIVVAPAYLPTRPSDRVRQLEEIASDLGRVSLRVSALQWNDSWRVATGCVFEEVTPDSTSGKLILAGGGCPFGYELSFADGEGASPDDIARSALAGTLAAIDGFSGARASVNRPESRSLQLTRVATQADPATLAPIGYIGEEEAWESRQLARDLARIQADFHALSGIYEGQVEAGGEGPALRARILVSATAPSAPTDRPRRPEEILGDLDRLALRISVTHWNSAWSMLSGCEFEDVRPDWKGGRLRLESADCPYGYTLTLGVSGEFSGLRESLAQASPREITVARVESPSADVPMGGYWVSEEEGMRIHALENDYVRRRRAVDKMAGTYRGSIAIDQTIYQARISLIAPPPPAEAGRLKTAEEWLREIENLKFDVEVTHWDSADEQSAAGCQVEGIVPDLANAKISIASPDCPNTYRLEWVGNPVEGDGLKGTLSSSNHGAARPLDLRKEKGE